MRLPAQFAGAEIPDGGIIEPEFCQTSEGGEQPYIVVTEEAAAEMHAEHHLARRIQATPQLPSRRIRVMAVLSIIDCSVVKRTCSVAGVARFTTRVVA